MKPLLSLIVGGRNDTYMGDFLWRLGTAINFLAESLEQINALSQVELVVCDWGSTTPLHTALALSPAGRSIARFVIVPPDMAAAAQLDSPFPIPIVQNVAIRRSRGEYIAQTDSDILFRPQTLLALLDILSGKRAIGVDLHKALMVCSRRHIPYRLAECYPASFELHQYIDAHGAMLPYEPLIPGFATPSGLALLHRSLWEETYGYDETLIYWGWMEIDLYLRLTQRFQWVDLDNHGVQLFHIEHYPRRDSSTQTRKMNPMEVPSEFSTGNSNWGFAGAQLEIASATGTSSPEYQNSMSWRAKQLQARGADGISRELCQLSLVEEVLETLRHIGQYLTPTPEMSQALNQYEIEFGLRHAERPSWDFRSAATWCASELKPLRYLALDAGATDVPIQVARKYNPVSIVAVESWKPHVPRMIGRPETLSEILKSRTQHAGQVRYLSGLAAETLQDLTSHLETHPRFDLITMGAIDNPSRALTTIEQLPSLLSLGGVALFGTTSEAAAVVLHEQIRKSLPLFTIIRGNQALLVCGVS